MLRKKTTLDNIEKQVTSYTSIEVQTKEQLQDILKACSNYRQCQYAVDKFNYVRMRLENYNGTFRLFGDVFPGDEYNRGYSEAIADVLSMLDDLHSDLMTELTD